MRSKFVQKALLIGSAVAAMQSLSLAANPTIYFTTGGGPGPGPAQITDSGTLVGNAAAKGEFTPADLTNSILLVTGSNGSYIPGFVNGIHSSASGDASDYVKVAGFSPTTDKVVFALKLDNGGTPIAPNASILNEIITDINTSNTGFGTSTLASLVTGNFVNTFPGYDILLSIPGSFANTIAAGSPPQYDFGFDFSAYTSADHPDIAGITVTDLGVVPEPACLGLLAGAGLVLLPRRRRNPA